MDLINRDESSPKIRLTPNKTVLSPKRPKECFGFRECNSHTVKDICIANVPSWKNLTYDDIILEDMVGSVTNRVFRATLKCKDKNLYHIQRVILKKTSNFNSSILDTEFQYKMCKLLGDSGCGPRIIGRFGDYTIQEWVEGKALTNESFQNISTLTALASSLAKFHKKATELAPKVWDQTPLVLRLIEKWSNPVEETVKKLNLDVNLSELFGFFDIYKRVLEKHLKRSRSPANFVLICHNDIFTLNVLDVQHGICLIDFDYTGYNYIGWEIANLFTKLKIVFDTVKPYLSLEKSLELSREMKSIFTSVYLSELLERNILPSDELVKEFLDSLDVHVLGTHIFWAFWSIVMIHKPTEEMLIPASFNASIGFYLGLFKSELKKLEEKNEFNLQY